MKFIKTNIFPQNYSVSDNWHFLRHDASWGISLPAQGAGPSLLSPASLFSRQPMLYFWTLVSHPGPSSEDQVNWLICSWAPKAILRSRVHVAPLPAAHEHAMSPQTCKSQTPACSWIGFDDKWQYTGKLHSKDFPGGRMCNRDATIFSATEGISMGCERSFIEPGMQLLLLWLHTKRCLAHVQLHLCIGRQAQVCQRSSV